MSSARFMRIVRHRLKSVFSRSRLDAELDAELSFHLDELTRELMAGGVPGPEARQRARQLVGNVALVADQCRDQRRLMWLENLRQDAAYGLRMLRREPTFTLVAVLSLAIGIGASGAVFSLIKAALVDPLPFPHADQLVQVGSVPPPGSDGLRGAAPSDVAAWRDDVDVFEIVGASFTNSSDFSADTAGNPAERVEGLLVTPDWFAALGVRPRLGRTFTADDTKAGPFRRVFVISDSFWRRRYRADPSIVGSRVVVDGIPQTIVGVMPADFRPHADRIEYWRPMAPPDQRRDGRGRPFGVIARLRAGVTPEQAQLALTTLTDRRAREDPIRYDGWGVAVTPLATTLYGWTRRPLLTMQAAVGLVLIIACVNIAGLLAARGSARRHEIRMRVSLGAGRSRIVRQLLTEGTLVAGSGGALGVAVAWMGTRLFVAIVDPQPGTPAIAGAGLSRLTLFAMATLTAISALACSLAPALAAARDGVSSRERTPRFRPSLVSAQVALALALLTGGALLVNSVLRLSGRDMHFDPARLLAIEYGVPLPAYARQVSPDPANPSFELNESELEDLERVRHGLQAIPGVVGVGASSLRPVDAMVRTWVQAVATGTDGPHETDVVHIRVTPRYFETIGASLLGGRDLGEADHDPATPVVVVNRAAARRLWPAGDPVGGSVRLAYDTAAIPRRVVGLVDDVPTRRAGEPDPIVYTSSLEIPATYRGPHIGMFGSVTFWVRTTGDPLAIVPMARQAALSVNPDRPLGRINTVERQLRASMRGSGTFAAVFGTFAAIAVLLAAIGIYGVLAYSVSHRAHEIGVRRTLGAGRREIIRLIAGQAVRIVASGITVGLLASFLVGRILAAQLWGITPTDGPTYASVLLVLFFAATAACVVPVRRALAVDPNVVLKSE